MRQRNVPLLARVTKRRRPADDCIETKARGLAVLQSPLLNKGTAFTAEERKSLGLTGLLPPDITTLPSQVKHAYLQYERLPDAQSRNSYLSALQDSNEVLFYRLFCDHLREMIPIVNNQSTVAFERRSRESGRSRGVYLSIDHVDAIEEAFANLDRKPDEIDLILASDATGIESSVGKLATYTAAGGIDPARSIPVMLDAGTNRLDLLEDPAYIGNRHKRIEGERYDAFIEAYVSVASRLFPRAVFQWSDFAPATARRILRTFHDRICTFNDDMQGTGAIALAAAISAVRVCGTPLRNQRIVILGAGTAGISIADQISDAMVREGLSKADAVSRFWCVDRQGLLTADMGDQIQDYQLPYARPAAKGTAAGASFSEVVNRVRPTMIVGTSNAYGSFSEAIVRDMAGSVERPILFALSRPRAQAEANPADLISWTEGRALIATGSPCDPVTYKGLTYVVAQVNNAMLYPGLCLGAIVSQASRISTGMFAAAASAVSSLVTVRQPGASLLPQVDDLRSVSATVAVAVAEAAFAEGLARVKFIDLVQEVQDAMWQPEYRRIQAS